LGSTFFFRMFDFYRCIYRLNRATGPMSESQSVMACIYRLNRPTRPTGESKSNESGKFTVLKQLMREFHRVHAWSAYTDLKEPPDRWTVSHQSDGREPRDRLARASQLWLE
jgi:hypothetical protein